MSFKRSSLEHFTRLNTVRAQHLFAVKTVAGLSARFLANTAADLASIATSLNSEKSQQTVMQKTGRQIIEKISFRDANFCLTLRTTEFPLSLAG